MMCVDCGADVPRLIDGSCAACFTKATKLVDVVEVVQLDLCAHCGARRTGAHWVDPPEGAPEAWVREQAMRDAVRVHERVQGVVVETDELEKDTKTFQFKIHVRGHVDDVDVEERRTALLRRSRAVCDRCSRINGGFYAAIVQLRATDRAVTPQELARAHHLVAKELYRAMSSGNRFAFLAKEEAIHGGWDYYIGDIDAGRNVSRVLKDRLGATTTETAKLVGRDAGDDVYRVTFLVRIQRFTSGDFAVAGKKLLAVQAVHPKSVAVLDLETHRRDRLREEEMTRLGGPEIVEQATLVSRDEAGIQVVDPKTFRTVVVLAPKEWSTAGDTVPVIRHEERLYWAGSPNNL